MQTINFGSFGCSPSTCSDLAEMHQNHAEKLDLAEKILMVQSRASAVPSLSRYGFSKFWFYGVPLPTGCPRVRIVPIVSYIAPCQASRVDRLKRCLPCHARRAVSLSRVDRVNGKGHDKMIPSRWVRCGLLWNRLDRVSRVSLQGRVSRVMSTMSAVSASVVLWMNIGSSCCVWICVSVLGRVVCYRGLMENA